MSQDQEHLHV